MFGPLFEESQNVGDHILDKVHEIRSEILDNVTGGEDLLYLVTWAEGQYKTDCDKADRHRNWNGSQQVNLEDQH
jgi:hypothetical protein